MDRPAHLTQDDEIRILVDPVEVEQRDVGEGQLSATLVGYAARFNTWAQIGGEMFGFMERIEPGAFADSVKSDDIRGLFNHDPSAVLGRTKSKTLALEEDAKGLRAVIQPPDTSAARDVVALVKRGDVSGMSFSFRVQTDEWEQPKKKGDLPKRTLKALRLFDVGPVPFPAYPTTSVKARDQAKAYQEAIERAAMEADRDRMRRLQFEEELFRGAIR